ncbi:serine hydrolase domain-containing protein [Sphingomonas sp. 28-63-12]|uniref:serine hydrolase domain-containing protein n=1 Tax=Sphingomonas sp. 28-63-12 TaxID=1970434 RepID=UPI0035A83E93
MKRLAAAIGAVWLVIGAGIAAPPPPADRAPPESMPALIDGMIASQLAEHHIAGATVSVVQDGKLIFAKGYGFADIDKRVPVVADRTLFRIGSISKVFTTIGTMQLAEAGKVKLDADVSRYLDFSFPRVSKAPLTLAHLMTHTAGFAESLNGLLVQSPKNVLPIGDMIKRTLPPLVRAPGTAPSYSNHGIALEGYIIERAAGEPFDDYMDRHVFTPLGMLHSSFREPLPPALAANLSHGHREENGRLVPQPFELTNIAPAGSISATATDMARFMIANLQLGTIDAAQILRPETAKTMQACHYRTDPRAACMAYGFYHQKMAGHDVIAHDGGTNLFLSNMVLVPDEQFGVFVSYNSPGGGKVLDELPRALIAQRFGTIAPPTVKATNFGDDIADYAGAYRTTRRMAQGWLKILGLPTSDISVAGPYMLKFGDRRWRQAGPGFFRDASAMPSDDSLIFHRDAAGKVDAFYLGNLPPVKLERIADYSSLGVAQAILVGFTLAALLFVIWAMVARRRWWASPLRGAVMAVLASIAFTLAGAITLVVVASDLESAGYGPPPAAQAMIALFDLGALAWSGAVILMVRGWRVSVLGWRSRAVMITALATALPLFALLGGWDLLGVAR